MDNLSQMQRHIEALNLHIDQRARERVELEAKHIRSLWKTNLYWLIGSILIVAMAIEYNKELIANNRILNSDTKTCQNCLINTVGVLRIVDEERNAYAEATEWFLEHSTPKK